MTDVQTQVMLTAMIEIAKRAKDRDEILEALQRIKDQFDCKSSTDARKRAAKTE